MHLAKANNQILSAKNTHFTRSLVLVNILYGIVPMPSATY